MPSLASNKVPRIWLTTTRQLVVGEFLGNHQVLRIYTGTYNILRHGFSFLRLERKSRAVACFDQNLVFRLSSVLLTY